jgi:hypothetical protein
VPEDPLGSAVFLGLERALMRPDVRASREAVVALLADDFLEFGRSGGVYDKGAVLDALAREGTAPAPPLPEVLDFAARRLAPGIVLVTYRSLRIADGTSQATWRSSIWRRSGAAWQMVFHQGTPASPGADDLQQ